MIKYYVEESLRSFQFCDDAKEFAKLLNGDELDIIDDVIGDVCDELSDVGKGRNKNIFYIYKGIVPKGAILFLKIIWFLIFFPIYLKMSGG